jgi:hypothetical protein
MSCSLHLSPSLAQITDTDTYYFRYNDPAWYGRRPWLRRVTILHCAHGSGKSEHLKASLDKPRINK